MASDPPRKLKREEDGSVMLPNGMVRDAETGKFRKPIGRKGTPDAVAKALAKKPRG